MREKQFLTAPKGIINDLAPDQLCVSCLIHKSLMSPSCVVPVLVRKRHAVCTGHKRLGHLFLGGYGSGPWRLKIGSATSDRNMYPEIRDAFC